MRAKKAAFMVACLLVLEGCVSAAVSVAGLAGTAAMDHVFRKNVDQTVPSSIAGAHLAALNTLKRMGMTIEKDERSNDRWTIHAKAESRAINVELREVSNQSVWMSVMVPRDDFVFIKDSSTANEFNKQMAGELARLTFKRIRIATAQMLLSDLGYDTKKTDGILDRKTRNAILRFQRKTKIRADGKVSARLVALLHEKRDALKTVSTKGK